MLEYFLFLRWYHAMVIIVDKNKGQLILGRSIIYMHVCNTPA